MPGRMVLQVQWWGGALPTVVLFTAQGRAVSWVTEGSAASGEEQNT